MSLKKGWILPDAPFKTGGHSAINTFLDTFVFKEVIFPGVFPKVSVFL
jgi:hypothetical protein